VKIDPVDPENPAWEIDY